MRQSSKFKNQIDQELKSLQFKQHASVIDTLKQTHKKSRFNRFMDQEIELSLLPIFSIVLLLFLWTGMAITPKESTIKVDKIVNIDGNKYWQSDLEGWIAYDEN